MRASFVSVEETATPRRILAGMDRAGVDELPVVGDDGVFAHGRAARGPASSVRPRRRERDGRRDGRGGDRARAAGRPIDDAIARMLAADLPFFWSCRPRGGSRVCSCSTTSNGCRICRDRRRRSARARGRRRGGRPQVLTLCSLARRRWGWSCSRSDRRARLGLPVWVSWVDALAALLAFIAAVAVSSEEMFSVPLWAAAGLGLLFAAGVGTAGTTGPATWVQLVLALGFFAMAVVVGSAMPRQRRVSESHMERRTS